MEGMHATMWGREAGGGGGGGMYSEIPRTSEIKFKI